MKNLKRERNCKLTRKPHPPIIGQGTANIKNPYPLIIGQGMANVNKTCIFSTTA